jgi:hypothetical protein
VFSSGLWFCLCLKPKKLRLTYPAELLQPKNIRAWGTRNQTFYNSIIVAYEFDIYCHNLSPLAEGRDNLPHRYAIA